MLPAQRRFIKNYGSNLKERRIAQYDGTIGLLVAGGSRYAGRALFQRLSPHPTRPTKSVPGITR